MGSRSNLTLTLTARSVLGALLVAALVGGCSGSGSGEGGASAGPAESGVESLPDLPEAPEVEVPDELEPVVGQADATADFCQTAVETGEAAIALDEYIAGGSPPRPDDELTDIVDPMITLNHQLAATAPEEAKADAELLAPLAETRLTILTASGGDPAAIAADQAYAEQAAGAQEAAARFASYVRSRCQVNLR